MNRCVCLGLGVYVDADEMSGVLRIEPCDVHQLPGASGETDAVVAGLRVDQCLEAIANVRDLLWPEGNREAPPPADLIHQIARALEFLRFDHSTRADANTAASEGRGGTKKPGGAGEFVAATIHQLVIIDVHCHLPMSCPECDASFQEPDSLLEEGYCGTNQPCSIAYYEGVPSLDGYGSAESIYEFSLVTGYRCGGCRSLLVSTEYSHPAAESKDKG